MKTTNIHILALAAACATLSLSGCEGLSLSVTPNGQIAGSYTMPPKAPPVIHAK